MAVRMMVVVVHLLASKVLQVVGTLIRPCSLPCNVVGESVEEDRRVDCERLQPLLRRRAMLLHLSLHGRLLIGSGLVAVLFLVVFHLI